MNQPCYLELELPVVTEWLPENDLGTPEENDQWLLREQAARWKPVEDRQSSWPSPELFELL